MKLRKLVFSTFFLAFAACDDGSSGSASEDRGPLGKADNTGSCAETECNGPAPTGSCWCDEQCATFGDCCEDFAAVCEDNGGGAQSCGGFAGLLCPDGQTCVDDPNDSCDPAQGGADCSGTCQPEAPEPQGQLCGGFAGLLCPDGQICVDDPNDGCDPSQGGADCSGTCQPEGEPTGQSCGGFAGLQCPEGLECVDDPSDSCDPANGGADCIGVCQ